MGYRKKYHNLRIVKYTHAPSGKKLTNKWAIVEGNMLVSAAAGLSKSEANRLLVYYQKQKVFVFTG